MKTDIHFWSYIGHMFLEWEMFQTEIVQKSKYAFYVQQTFFFENLFVYER
jgi:hypothetical protein